MTQPLTDEQLAAIRAEAESPHGSVHARWLLAEVDRLRAELAESDEHINPRHWPTFAEHASPEAIAAYIAIARRRQHRTEQYIDRLEALQATKES